MGFSKPTIVPCPDPNKHCGDVPEALIDNPYLIAFMVVAGSLLILHKLKIINLTTIYIFYIMKNKKITQKKIESIGFVFIRKDGDKLLFLNKSPFNRDEKIYLGSEYESLRYVAIENNCGQFYFMGWLKNNKELKKVLKQVGVEFEKVSICDQVSTFLFGAKSFKWGELKGL